MVKWLPGWARRMIVTAIEAEIDEIDAADVEKLKAAVKERVRRLFRV
jgi:hypothetical protein